MRPHPTPFIITASATLIGICFFVLTNLVKLEHLDKTHIDEATAISLFFFLCSCYTAYLSVRTKDEKKSAKIEKFADTFFLIGLTVISFAALLFALRILK